MKNLFRISGVILFILSIFLTSTCKKEEKEPKIIKQKVTGYVQKGPYVNGTSISMNELNSSLVQTGKFFTTQIIDNSGSFEINNVSLTSSYVEFSASGYYFDEVKGDISIAPLNLYALSDITDISTVNVNILTHLEKKRVDYLVKQNKTFSEAKKIAQGEILAIFSFSLSGMNNSEALDISVNNEGNAILLAISIILQGNRSVGDLTELLANITSDISEDGILNSDSIMTNLRNSTKELILTTIRSNLQNRYQALGINASIPGFEKYINDFLAFTGEKPSVTTQAATNIKALSATLNGMVNANSLSTTVSFEWGKTISYGDSIPATQSPVTGSSSVSVSVDITGLSLSTTYYVRISGTNQLGTTTGQGLTFTTSNGIAVLTTSAADAISATSVVSGGNIITDGGYVITARGTCLSTSHNPTISDTYTVDGNGSGLFTSTFTGLTSGTIYYIRSYATNSIGTSYGDEISFTTLTTVPALTTTAVSSITQTTVASGGNVTSDGGATVTSRGVCWSTSENPTTTNSKTTNGSGTGTFTSSIIGLTPNTPYYVRAYATNSAGTEYGSIISFTTQNYGAVTDIDGNVYKTITIGTQVWMAENLKTTNYNDGTALPLVTDPTAWSVLTTPGYCWYYNDAATYNATYGAMYNWYAVDAASNGGKNVCPTAWHVPTDAEWTTLTTYLGGEYVAGSKLKEVGTTHWTSQNTDATNETGFTALPGGQRDLNGTFYNDVGIFGYWWSSTESNTSNAWYRSMHFPYSGVYIFDYSKRGGNSVRCIRDN